MVRLTISESFRGGGGGTENYNDLINKPSINGNTLVGDITIPYESISMIEKEDGVEITITDASTGETHTTVVHNGTDGEKGDAGAGIEEITFNDDYTLTIKYGDGAEITTEPIRGEKGEQGEPGIDGVDGVDGVGITDITYNSDYTLTIEYGDGHTVTTESLRGTQGEPGTDGQDGEKGDKGDPGEDYVITEEDYETIVQQTLEKIPAAEDTKILSELDPAEEVSV